MCRSSPVRCCVYLSDQQKRRVSLVKIMLDCFTEPIGASRPGARGALLFLSSVSPFSHTWETGTKVTVYGIQRRMPRFDSCPYVSCVALANSSALLNLLQRMLGGLNMT